MQYAAFSFGVPFDASFNADERNASMNILYLYQGGLTLGQKEYYLDTDKATVDIREAYKKHLIKMFQLFGFNAAQAKAKGEAVLRFETALAKFSKSSTELRDVEANYNKIGLFSKSCSWTTSLLRGLEQVGYNMEPCRSQSIYAVECYQ